jgi:RNA polymerase sigma-70 factor (ECF subfamily)
MVKQQIVELARRASKGDAGAFVELCVEKQRDMMFVAMSILGNVSDAEDAAQEAILKMYKSIGGLRDAGAINVWIERIVRNESYKIYNAHTRTRDDLEIDDENITVEVSEDDREFLPEAYAEDASLSENLYKKVMSLPPARRDAIIMYYYEGLSYKEIAAVTGISIKSVSSNITKARMMLKKILSNEDSGGIRDAKAMLGLAPTATVMGRSLKLHSVNSLPDDKMAAFAQKWTTQIHNTPFPVRAKAQAWKVITSVTATVAVFSAVVFGIVTFDSTDKGNIDKPVQTAPASAREIIFTGDDCECGHINPQSVAIANTNFDAGEPAWEIISEANGEIIFTGNTAAVNEELAKLEETVPDGRFTIKCTILDKDKNETIYDRNFTIGNYSGDINAE